MAPANRKNPKRADSSESDYSLIEFMRDFPDDDACLEWLWATRYAKGSTDVADCPKCERERVFKKYATAQGRQSWTCTGCGLHIHPTAGTIFHKSSTSLQLWFYAMYLMTSTRCGISAKQVERELGVTYKTAWRMCHLIRNELMDQDDEPLSGEVEMDETYVGGKPRVGEVKKRIRETGESPMQAGQAVARAKKSTVFGMVQRGGKVAAYVTDDKWQDEAFRHVETRVMPASTIYTDEAPAYAPLTGETWEHRGYEHRRIQHQQRVYVSGDVHTQTMEGFWSLVKNGIRGVHHSVSAKHLQGYLNEYVWRYNLRHSGRAMFLTLALRSALPTE